ncbi:hypothetical protein D3C80_592430 [compost metagenome]
MPGMPPHMSASMLTMLPPVLLRPWLNTSRATRKPPTRLVRTTASKPFWLIEASGAGYWPPALLTRWWMTPRSASTAATMALTASSSRMSQACQLALPPSSTISPAVFSNFSGLRPTSTTWAPRAASSWAVQRPMPLPPPVTMMVWPLNRPGLNTES